MSLSVANALVVLVVEDEFLLRSAIAAALRDAGYLVVETPSGEEAMAWCRSDMTIDIVFTDINLIGDANGWDVAACIRTQRPDVPVLYTSGQLIDRRNCVPRSLFVAKPYHHSDILTACGKLRGTALS